MSRKKNSLNWTAEQKVQNNINHKLAEDYFVEQGLMPKREDRTETWVLHHKDPSWLRNDVDRYIQWNPDDLVPMTDSEHVRLHNALREVHPMEGKRHTEETKHKISQSLTGKTAGEKNGFYGKCHSEETRKKMSEKAKLRTGEKHPQYGKRGKDCPMYGKHWKTIDGRRVYY